MAFSINKLCTKCAACILECPTGSIIEGPTQYYIDADTCMNHAACVAVCPVNAIHPLKTQKAVETATPAKTQTPPKSPKK